MDNMKLEIERKFLVRDNWPRPDAGRHCIQGYISAEKDRVVRVRIMDHLTENTPFRFELKISKSYEGTIQQLADS
jgi:CYTH domain-containing protein